MKNRSYCSTVVADLLRVVGLLVVFLMAAGVGKAYAVTVSLQGPSSNPGVGKEFTVQLKIDSVTDLYGLAADLVYDTQYLDIVDSDAVKTGVQPRTTEGTLINRNGADVSIFRSALQNSAQGRVVLGLTRSGAVSGVSAASASTVLSVNFRARKQGTTAISFGKQALKNSTNANIAVAAWPQLSLTIIGPPDITVAPVSFNFGSVNVGDQSALKTFTITNAGAVDLAIGTLTVIGPHSSMFELRNDGCSGQTIIKTGSCTVDALFGPLSGGAKSATLRIPSDDPDSPNKDVALSGTGVNVPNLRVSGVLLKENFAAGLPASWTNADAWATNATCARAMAAPFVTPWAIADSTCKTTTTETLTTKAFSARSCTSSELSFTSAGAWNSGNGNGSVDVSADGGGTWANKLLLTTDEAPGWKTFDISEVAGSTGAKIRFVYFNSTAVGYWAIDNVWVTCMPAALKFTANNEVQTILVENSGSVNLVTGTLALSGANSADFSLQNNLCNSRTMIPGDTCSTDVKFTTSSAGTRNAVLNIPSNDSDKPTTTVTLTGATVAIGDTDGNGIMNIVDALFVARYAAGLTVGTFYPEAADVNCDKTVNIVDALFIARKAAGLTVTGWCGP